LVIGDSLLIEGFDWRLAILDQPSSIANESKIRNQKTFND